MKTLIKNIKQIFGVTKNNNTKLKCGNDMSEIEIIENGWILIENDIIADFEMKKFTGIDDWNNTKIIDSDNGSVIPTWCDSHTHIVYAGNRSGEFVDRVNGLSYEEIAKNGGGILNSAELLSKTSFDELYMQSSED